MFQKVYHLSWKATADTGSSTSKFRKPLRWTWKKMRPKFPANILRNWCKTCLMSTWLIIWAHLLDMMLVRWIFRIKILKLTNRLATKHFITLTQNLVTFSLDKTICWTNMIAWKKKGMDQFHNFSKRDLRIHQPKCIFKKWIYPDLLSGKDNKTITIRQLSIANHTCLVHFWI